jgi:hypothetical protein
MDEKRSISEFSRVWTDAVGSRDAKVINSFLIANSGLPGPRGNLTLSHEAAEKIAALWSSDIVFAKTLLQSWETSKVEYLRHCFAVACGAVCRDHSETRTELVPKMRRCLYDQFWRTREGVMFGLQEMTVKEPAYVVTLLEDWCREPDAMLLRNAVIVLSEPRLLKADPKVIASCLSFHKRAISFYRKSSKAERKTSDFQLLKKTLGFSASVLISVDPTHFPLLEEWATNDDADVRWIVKENLKKARIAKAFPDKVANLARILQAHSDDNR